MVGRYCTVGLAVMLAVGLGVCEGVSLGVAVNVDVAVEVGRGVRVGLDCLGVGEQGEPAASKQPPGPGPAGVDVHCRPVAGSVHPSV